ncbi:MAG: glycosyltransferase family 4 protein [Sedimenticola sp.]
MNDRRVLIVTEYFYPRNRPDSYFLTEISKAIYKAANGNVKVICNSDLEGKEELQFVKDKITRLSGYKLNARNLLQRFIMFTQSTMKLGWHTLLSINNGDRVFSVTNPAFLILILGVIKWFKNFEYTLLVYDVFPENMISANIVKEDSIFYVVLKKLFDWSYRQADHLIVIGRDMQELIGSKTHNAIPMSLITNWCDIEKVVPQPKTENQIIKNHGLDDKVVFSFVGNFGRVQGIEMLLEVASLVRNVKFRLLFIGDGALLPSINNYINENPNGNVIYAGSFPASEQNSFLNACDVAIISLSRSMYGLGVPSKSYYNMAANKPLFYLGDEKSEIGRVIIENNIGWVLNNMTANMVAEKIDSIIDDDIYLQSYGDKARRVVEKCYSKDIILHKYIKLFTQ